MNENWIALSASGPDVAHDESGVPVEWTLFSVGDTRFCRNGRDGSVRLTSGDLDDILAYHEKKGEQIPVDSEHYLYELANRKNLDEAETARMFPQGVAALGFGALSRAGDKLRIRVKWSDAAHEMLKEKIYKYFSPVFRGLRDRHLRRHGCFFVPSKSKGGQKAKKGLRSGVFELILRAGCAIL